MATELAVYGPFEIACDTNGKVKRISKDQAVDFWTQSAVAALKTKQGCYVFAVRAGKGFTPWYVGQASKSFEQECFTDHKLNHFNDALFKGKKGTPVMFFVAPTGNKNKVPAAELNHMEKELTQDALEKNPELRNIQNTKNLPQWSIKGVVRSNRGAPSTGATQFAKMMGLK